MTLISGGRNKQKMLQSMKTSEAPCVVERRGKADTTHNRKRAEQVTFSHEAVCSCGKGWHSSQLRALGGVSRGEADILGLLGSTSSAARDQKEPSG